MGKDFEIDTKKKTSKDFREVVAVSKHEAEDDVCVSSNGVEKTECFRDRFSQSKSYTILKSFFIL